MQKQIKETLRLAEEMGFDVEDMSGALEDVARIMSNNGLDVFTVFKTWGYRNY